MRSLTENFPRPRKLVSFDMQKIIDSVRNALEQKNWYAALFVVLTLPDICIVLEYGKTSGKEYSQWFEHNLPQYKGFLSGDDCYALRCATLHEGRDNISQQRMRYVLDHFIFSTSNNHRILFKKAIINGGQQESFLQLNVGRFCAEICDTASQWLLGMHGNKDVMDQVSELIVIHEPGYVYKGVVKFG